MAVVNIFKTVQKNIAIFGAGGFGREVKTIIDAINSINPKTYEFIGFFDDAIHSKWIPGFGRYARN